MCSSNVLNPPAVEYYEVTGISTYGIRYVNLFWTRKHELSQDPNIEAFIFPKEETTTLILSIVFQFFFYIFY